MCLLFSSCSLLYTKNNKFNVNITQVQTELKDYSYGSATDYETVISVYGTVKANVECEKIKVSCDVYSKYDKKICSPAGTFNIKNGQTISFNIYALPQNSGHLDKPYRIKNINVNIIK